MNFSEYETEMSFLKPLRIKLHQRQLNKKMLKTNIIRNSISFDKVQSIGIVFNALNKDQEVQIIKYKKKLKEVLHKKVHILGYYNDKEDRSLSSTFKFYNKKSINWLSIPQNDDINNFMNEKFDLVINFLEKPHIHADYIMSLCNARFRIGRNTENTHAYDMIINEANKDTSHFIKQIENYLKIFNNKVSHGSE